LNESIDVIREQQSALVSVAQETASSLNAVQSGLLQTNGALDMQHENIQQLCAQATELSEHIDTTRQTLAEVLVYFFIRYDSNSLLLIF
jgi:septal ring factor EnvC (AmiA/AmiB activator)